MEEDMKATVDHEEIRSWIESHGGRPEIMETNPGITDPILRINFPGPQDENLLPDAALEKSVSWEKFFHHFDDMNLAFLYQEEPRTTDLSLAYRFIKRDQLESEIPVT
jgi:hypothetical protein